MFKKIVLFMFFVLMANVVWAQSYAWRYRTHATDCTALTDGKFADLCFELDSQRMFKCVPSVGDCDTSGEWKEVKGILPADPSACSSGQYVSDIDDEGNLTCGSPAGSSETLQNAYDNGNTIALSTASGDLGIATSAGTDIFFIDDSAEQIGMGTSTPNDTLDIVGTLDVSSTIDGGGFTEGGSNTLSNDISGNAATATALAANGSNCSAGSFPLGVDASGAAESCTAQNPGTDITADLEEETHASEHAENAADEILAENLGTACVSGYVLKSDGAGGLDCAADNAGGGSAIIFDIGDDAGNDSTDLGEIATSGDTNSIFTEPTADKMLIDLSNNWPGADTATALAANGANCSAGQVPLGVDASGAAEGCLDVWTEAENTSAAYIANVSEDTTPQLGGDLDSNANNIILSTGTAIQTGTTATNTALLQAYDVDGAAYVTFATLTAANTPTFDLASGTTLGGAAIQTGTDDDVPESGDFGAAGDLEADGTLSADVVAAAEMADADHGDISWSSGVASIDSGVVDGAELADAITLDATTTIDMDSNTADLNFDSDTLFIDQSTNRVGIGTSTPSTALHVNGDITATNVDFTGSMAIPDGTAPTVDASGEFALDTSASQIVYYDGSAVRVLGYELSDFVAIESLAAADDNLPIGTRSYARTITSVGCRCIGTCTTPAQISLEDTGGNAMTHTTPTCATTGAVTYQSVTAGGGLTAGEGLVFDVDNTPSPETDTYEILWTETRDRQ